MQKVSGIVLAGGQSQRMGRPKGLLRLGGKTIIERVLSVLAALCQEVLVVTNQPATYGYLGVPLVTDRISGKGPLAGLHAGLMAATWERSLVLACDLPYVEVPLLSCLLCEGEGYAAGVPIVRGYPEPLVATYTTACLPAIERLLETGEHPRVVDFYPRVSVRYIPEHRLNQVVDVSRAFLNVNTPADWEMARRKA